LTGVGVELTKEKTAQFFGVDPRTVERWRRDGCHSKQSGKRTVFNSAEVAEWLKNRERSKTLEEIGDVDVAEAERRKIIAEAGLAEIKKAQAEGSLVSISAFEVAQAAMIGAARAKLLSLPGKLAPLVILCREVPEAKDLIEEKVHEALSELASENVIPRFGTEPAQSAGDGQEDAEALGAASRSEHQRVGRRKSTAKPGSVT